MATEIKEKSEPSPNESLGSPPPSVKIRRWMKWMIPLFSVLMIIFLLEIVLRLTALLPKRDWFNRQTILEKSENPLFNSIYTDSDRPVIPHANQNYPDFRFPLRDYHYSPKKPENTFRILGIGDSFAWGFGVNDNRYTMLKRLECWFEKENREPKIEIINAARPAWATFQEENFLQKFGYALNPDLIVVVFNLNDGAHFHGMATFDNWAQTRVQKRENWLHRISKLYRWIDVRITQASVHNWTVQTYHDSYLGDKQDLWVLCKKALIQMSQECKKRKITLVVSIFPLLISLENKEYLFAREVQVIEDFLKRKHILCNNMLPDFMGKKSESLWSLPSDSHPNERGHQIAAESLYRFLAQNNLVSPIKKS